MTWGEGKAWFYLYLAFLFMTAFVTQSFFRQVQWHISHGSSFYEILHRVFLSNFAPWVLFGLSLVPLSHSRWRTAFQYKNAKKPLLTLLLFALLAWTFLGESTVTLLDFKWRWPALITYIGLALTLLFLYSKREIDAVHAFTLAFFSVLLCSILYEVPPHMVRGDYGFAQTFKFRIPLGAMPILLLYWHYEPNKWTIASLVFMCFVWLTHLHTGYVQTVFPQRFAAFPLALSLPLGLPRRRDEK